jgi:pimeloyl-ACP methyl ester carboxylesterase
VPELARGLAAAGGRAGLFDDGGQVSVTAGESRPAPAPRGLADLLRGIRAVDPDLGARPGGVRVQSVLGAGGRRAWVVQIPGTQNWSPKAGADPLDLTSNVYLTAGERTASQQLVVQAMRAAGVPAGEPVLMVGHSQGGIIAASLAADPAFRSRFSVTHVLTAGSPVAACQVPRQVSVLSLEHDEDVVPRLDGRPNPDRPGWITVSRSTRVAGAAPSLAVGHHLGSYIDTAVLVDASNDPSVRAWRAGLEPFLAASGRDRADSAVIVTGTRVAADDAG